MYYFSRELPAICIYRMIKIFFGTLIVRFCYDASFVLLYFLVVFILLNFFLYNLLKQFFLKAYLQALRTLCLILIGTILFVYGVHTFCTLFLKNSVISLWKAFVLRTHNYSCACPQLFRNCIIRSNNFSHYFSKYLFITTSAVVLLNFLWFFIFIKNTL